MPSNSLNRWRGEHSDALDEIENAHAVVGGTGRGRRYATRQINHAYAALLSSQFQGFCRDLHSECVDHVAAVAPAAIRSFLRVEFVWNRALDRGNPSPGNVGQDFNRLGIDFWPAVRLRHTRNDRRRQLLQELVAWRNAIAHQDFGPLGGDPTLHLPRVRAWRRAVGALADAFDRTMYDYLVTILGTPPW
jgi:hypothetical protein